VGRVAGGLGSGKREWGWGEERKMGMGGWVVSVWVGVMRARQWEEGQVGEEDVYKAAESESALSLLTWG
jgi:hypothetical protein